ncbi:MAG: hypothetical protein A2Y94_03235 [Caldithrix sp. RBG_13_44_9]|nr:MAG: hypothetical protein A2Y94_03235 [Caldithrix sp. RBG_13_44_9]
MSTSKRSLILLIIFLLGYEIVLYLTVADKQPLWHDEGHFIETIKYLADDLSLERLKNYNEMSTPLPFLVYALWGKIVSFELPALRLLSLTISFFTFLSFYFFFRSWYDDTKTALILTGFLIFQPYMIGVTVFVYTDMLTMFFLATSLISLHKYKPIIFSVSMAGGLLCRQYLIFWCLATFIYFLWSFYIQRDRRHIEMMLSILVAMLPIGLLFLFWKGLSPQNALHKQYVSEGLSFHFSFIVFYICMFLIYLLPLIVIRRRSFYRNIKIYFVAFILSGGYLLYPIKASQPAEQAGVFTTGYFHRFIRWMVNESCEHLVFYLVFLLSLPVFIHLSIRLYRQRRNRSSQRSLFSDLAIFSFLITMAFSYVNWEKYLLPVIPLAILSILGEDGLFNNGKSKLGISNQPDKSSRGNRQK